MRSKPPVAALKVVTVVVMVLCSADGSYAQSASQEDNGAKERANTFSMYGGMGIAITAAPGLVKYLNTLPGLPQQVTDFGTNVEFFGGAEFPLSVEWGGALEYSYLFKSYNLPTLDDAGTYTIFYSLHMPTVMVHYVVPGKGYFIKLGGGIGYHTGSIEQKSSLYGTDSTYSAHGVGFKVQVVGQTAFDDHMYGYIGGDMRWELLGKVKGVNGAVLQNNGQSASLSMFAVGLSFGVIYYF